MSIGDAAARMDRPSSERADLRRLLWVGPLIVAAAIVANVLFVVLTARLLTVDPAFMPLTPGAVAMFTLFGTVGAVVVFAIVAWFARRPFSLYRKIALGVLLVSLIPDVALAFGPEPASWIEVILLMITHVIAAAIVVWMLERFARRA